LKIKDEKLKKSLDIMNKNLVVGAQEQKEKFRE
jgi:hypothetical protein